MKLLDGNCSYGRNPRPPHRFAATPEDLIEQMDYCGIEAALVFHTNQRFASPATGNRMVVDETRHQPRLLPTWAILPDSCGELPPAEDLLEQMKLQNIRALWAFPQEHRYRLDGDTFPELFRLITRHRIPLLAKENLFHLKELLRDCPDLIVVAMNQGPHGLDRHLRPLLDAFPNLYVDTSYMITAGMLEGLCDRYGPDRLIFGTAYPDNCAGGALACLLHADIGEEAKRLIAAGNLERLLAWNAPAVHRSNVDRTPRAAESLVVAHYLAQDASDACPIIDMHGHWGPFGGLFLPQSTEEQMIASLKQAGVRRLVCSAHDALFADPERGNRAMQQAILRRRDMLSGYWVINPNYPGPTARVPEDFEKTEGFVGLKLLPDYHVHPLTSPNYRPALEYANAKKLLVLVHTWGGSAFDSPQMLGEVAAQYPQATFIMGHSGYGDWPAAIAAARQLANVYLDLTAVYVAHDFGMLPSGSGTPAALISCLQVNGILEHFVEQVGSKKILFGSDMPWYGPHFVTGTVLLARVSDDARRDILYRNASWLLQTTVSTSVCG
jgi:uncharacterized protein